MIVFRCCCQWVFIVGKKKVFGAFYPEMGNDGMMQRLMKPISRKQFKINYSDCHRHFTGKHNHHD